MPRRTVLRSRMSLLLLCNLTLCELSYVLLFHKRCECSNISEDLTRTLYPLACAGPYSIALLPPMTLAAWRLVSAGGDCGGASCGRKCRGGGRWSAQVR